MVMREEKVGAGWRGDVGTKGRKNRQGERGGRGGKDCWGGKDGYRQWVEEGEGGRGGREPSETYPTSDQPRMARRAALTLPGGGWVACSSSGW